MEKRINKKIHQYLIKLKQDIKYNLILTMD